MNQLSIPKRSLQASTQSVKFSDGMLVTAEDMRAATDYPLRLLQVLVRSYFGCGIVCGLELETPPRPAAAPGYEAQPGGAQPALPPNFVLRLKPGVALDCAGFPIEVCETIELNLKPDPCAAGQLGEDFEFERCIAIRRVTSDELPRPEWGCGYDNGPEPQCTRLADHVLVQAFPPDELPDGICRVPPPSDDGAGHGHGHGPAPAPAPEEERDVQSLCDCLTTCRHCDRCGEGWVLLGCVYVTRQGLSEPDCSSRLHVKPVECLCDASRRAEEGVAGLVKQYADELKELRDYVRGELALVKAQIDIRCQPHPAVGGQTVDATGTVVESNMADDADSGAAAPDGTAPETAGQTTEGGEGYKAPKGKKGAKKAS